MANTILIASGKGGVGKSSLTVGLCRAMVSLGKRVLAVDCDVGLRSLDVLLHTGDSLVFDWGDAAAERCEAERAILHIDSFDLLAAPLHLSDDFDPELLKKLIQKLDDAYDYIFLDAPAGVTGDFAIAATAAEAALIVSTPDALCLRSAGIAADTLRSLGVTEQRLVLNRFQKMAVRNNFLVSIDDAIDRTGVQLIGVVPEDPEVTFRLPKGEPLPKKSPAKLAYERIAKRVDGKRVPLKIV